MRTLLTLASLVLSQAFTTSGLSPKWMKEAEKKHARVALLAVPSLMTIAQATGEDPVAFLNSQPVATQLAFYSSAALLESLNLRRFGKDPFTLKDDEEPGKLLPLAASPNLHAVEDWTGRIAMLVAAGYFANTLGEAFGP